MSDPAARYSSVPGSVALQPVVAGPATTTDPAQGAPAGGGEGRKPVCLVGMMGAGKTTLGRQLAAALERPFVDLDQALEARCGVRVTTIFDIEGEAGFRRRETAILDEYTRQFDLVLATGGGAVLAPENREMLRTRACVIYLQAEAHELYQRVARDRNRPLLQTEDPQGRIVALLEQREPLYAEVAHITVATGRQPASQILRRLVAQLGGPPT